LEYHCHIDIALDYLAELDHLSACWNLHWSFIALFGFVLVFEIFGIDKNAVFHQEIGKRNNWN
jgi:hypothetical protein